MPDIRPNRKNAQKKRLKKNNTMPKIKEEFVSRVIERSKGKDCLLEVIRAFGQEPRKEGASWKTACPLCGSEHSLVITPGKSLFKCFNCNALAGKYPIDYLMSGQKMSFPDAIEWLANYFGMLVEYEEPVRKQPKEKPSAKKKPISFNDIMLAGSGLTPDDTMATVYDSTDSTVTKKVCTFKSGTVNSRGEIVDGDDSVIRYFDLDGYPLTYTLDKDKASTPREYFRVRYQFPEEHTDKNGRPIKYRSPSGSPTFIYIPQKIRDLYRRHADIPRLFIQEGEKKAEKACKHGIMSVAVSGIQNLGYKGTLPEEIVKLIETCHVQEVVFLLDSDCFDLTSKITVDDPVDRRPKCFFSAVKNYKEYFNRVKNRGIYLEIYFGYVLKNASGDKGIDDLLADALKGKEDELLGDINTCLNEKDLTGKYVQFHKITTSPDSKIAEIFRLNDTQAFCNYYKEQLLHLPEFKIGSRKMRFNDAGNLEPAQPIEKEEEFWTARKRKGTEDVEYYFKYTGAELFLEHHGFYRHLKDNGGYEFIQVENSIMKVVEPWEIANFVKEFTKDTLPKEILELIYRGGTQYLGPQQLTMLDFFHSDLDRPVRGRQHLFFKDCWWQVAANEIERREYTQMNFNIWKTQIKDYKARQLPSLIDISKDHEGHFTYTLTDTGKKCDFLRFLENASNFTWRKEAPEPQELLDNAQHLVAKLSAFGYLCVAAKDKSVSKAVIGMDGKQSDLGVSNGRSGKSLFGEALKVVTTTRHYNGKEFSGRMNNAFIWDGIDEKTNIVFIDDAMRDFDFELLFSLITGDWPINAKGQRPFILPFQKSPKIYLTTNHSISGDGSSFVDRQWLLAFSDYYNDTHKPTDDFGNLFFDEWDDEQFELFWNFVAQCIQIYFRFGYVPVPDERLVIRKLQQDIGDEYILWADEYFSAPEHVNHELRRQEIYDSLLEYVGPSRRAYYSPKTFKQKLIKYCRYRDYIFNPEFFDPVCGKYVKLDKDGRPVFDNKRNGIEYFTVGNSDFFNGTRTCPGVPDSSPIIEIPSLDDPVFDLNLDGDLPD